MTDDPIEIADVVAQSDTPRDEEINAIAGFLKINELFRGIDEASLHRIATTSKYHWIVKGEAIIKEGESGSSFYLIRKGTVQVSTKTADKEVNLAELGPGSFFGEVSVFNNTPRTATVTALNDMEIYEFSRDEVEPILAEFPSFRGALDALILKRSQDTIHKLGFDKH